MSNLRIITRATDLERMRHERDRLGARLADLEADVRRMERAFIEHPSLTCLREAGQRHRAILGGAILV